MDLYDRSTGVAMWKGYVPSQRRTSATCRSMHIKHGAYGIGYPR